MIKDFIHKLVELTAQRDDVVFITGDVGYQSLDPIKELLGDRFINAGVAEQNMINVAAGMAVEGFKVYVYSIAPFLLYRAYEQIKLNVASRNLDINLIANGGGYGYGIMGPTHHALNDLSLLNGLENIKGFVPACKLDVDLCAEISMTFGPKYFRLGLNDQEIKKTKTGSFGKVSDSLNATATVVTLGPIAQELLEEADANFDHYTCFEFPFTALPSELIQSISKTRNLLVAEEHTEAGGVGEKLKSLLQKEGLSFEFIHRFSNHYEGGYGDQVFHRKQCKLDRESLLLDLG